MPIDRCQHTFEKLSGEVLPRHMTAMRKSLANASPVAAFLEEGKGVKRLLRDHGKREDFSGCYVFLLDGAPYYVGISRQLFRRVWYHCRGTRDFQATLAYSMASKTFVLEGTRKSKMGDEAFLQHFHLAREKIRKSTFAYAEILNDLELYLFEAYCAVKLDTYAYNSFRTH